MIRNSLPPIVFLIALLVCSCGPGDLTISGLEEEIIEPNVKYFYYEQGEHIKTTTVKSRTIREDESRYRLQYCSVNDAVPFCGEMALSTDTAKHRAVERTESRGGERKSVRTTAWAFAAMRTYTAHDELLAVYRFDSEQELIGCNSMFWCPPLGVIHWKNFINTMVRRTEYADDPDRNKLLELLLVHIKRDKAFYEDCTFVHKSILN